MKRSVLGYALKREIRITTSAITGRKLELSFAGDGAWTTRTEMRLPAIHDAQIYDLEDARVLRGYADHEAGHHRYTPFDVVDTLQRRRAGINIDDPQAATAMGRVDKVRHFTTFNIWNAVEDYRIERNDMRDLPGTRKNLDATRRHVLSREKGIFEADISRMDDPYAMASAAFTWLNACENRYTSSPLATELLAKLERQNPFVHSLAIAKWADVLAASELTDAAANREIYRIASEVCDAIISRYPPEDQPHTPTSSPEAGSDAGPTSGDAQSGKMGDSCDPQDGVSGGTPTENANRDNSASSPQRKSQETDPAISAPAMDQDPNGSSAGTHDASDSRENAIKNAAKQHQPEKREQLDISDLAKKIAEVSNRMPGGCDSASSKPLSDDVVRSRIDPCRTDLAHYGQVRSQISGVTTALSGAMRAIVIAKDLKKYRSHREDGTLDMGNVAGIALRSPDVYEQIRVSPANHTSIDFLLDVSYSMKSKIKARDAEKAKEQKSPPLTRINLLMQSLIALTEALGPARKVRTRYLAFSSDEDAVKIYLIKDYHQGLTETKHQLELLMDGLSRDLIPMGSTPTGQAMLDAWSDQRQRPDNKKIQIILTDGEPDHDSIELAEQAADTIKREGGHAIGIGIGGRKPNFKMEKWVLVPEIEKLPTEILGSLKTLLK